MLMADWDRVKQDLGWCLVEGRGVDGRDVMFEALQMKDAARARSALQNGFLMSQRDDESVAIYLDCAREDHARLFNLARSLIGLRPLPGPDA
jgi:hypothetical protein